MTIEEIIGRFKDIFTGNSPAVIASCPGRINLIGEHIDYNQGHVLPMAIQYRVWVSIAQNSLKKYRFFSELDQEIKEILIHDDAPLRHWTNFPIGALEMLGIKDQTSGLDFYYAGNIPVGAGVSSSAAISVVTIEALNTLYRLKHTKEEIAFLGQRIEHEKIHVRCGIMDQFAVCLSKKDMALLLDTLDNSYRYIPFDLPGTCLGIIDSQVSRSLDNSAYNARRMECEDIITLIYEKGIAKKDMPLARLSDAQYEKAMNILDESLKKRLRHIHSEEKRVLNFCKALANNDAKKVGALLSSTHASLTNDYEVSIPELNFLVEKAIENNDVFGARLIGAGFGGCVLVLFKNGKWEEITDPLLQEYSKRFNRKPKALTVKSDHGSRLEFQTE